eukprot:COSAG04_NODE_1238_length_7610_cov_17.233125_4_plen_162_part_00
MGFAILFREGGVGGWLVAQSAGDEAQERRATAQMGRKPVFSIFAKDTRAVAPDSEAELGRQPGSVVGALGRDLARRRSSSLLALIPKTVMTCQSATAESKDGRNCVRRYSRFRNRRVSAPARPPVHHVYAPRIGLIRCPKPPNTAQIRISVASVLLSWHSF